LTSNNWSNSTIDQSYSEALTYDANGNIQALNRNASQGAKMDQLSYTYERIANGFDRNSNRLVKVTDNSNDLNLNDIKKGDHTYAYDELGQLTKDDQENIENITWTVDGKILSIQRKQVANTGPDVEFQYNAKRQRVAKIVKPRDATTGQLKDQDQWTITHYVLDYSGNATGIYEHQYSKLSNQYKEQLLLTERSLYDAGRLGIKKENLEVSSRIFSATLDPVYHTFVESNTLAPTVITLTNEESKQRLLGHKLYELGDHLKNTLATVSDKKSAGANSYSAIVLSANNYYPFGMTMPNANNLNTSSGYRYGFNGMEKDDEVKGTGNSYTTEFRQYDPRLARWSSIDPAYKAHESPFVGYANNPVIFIDPAGSDPIAINDPNYQSIDPEYASNSTNTSDDPLTQGPQVSNAPITSQKSSSKPSISIGQILQNSIDESPDVAIDAEDLDDIEPEEAGAIGPALKGGLLISGALAADDATGIGAVDDIAIPVVIATAAVYDAANRVFVTYTKIGPDGTVYSGRSSGYGSPYDIVEARDRTHFRLNKLGFSPAILDEVGHGWPIGLAAIRGREQQLIDKNGGAKSDTDNYPGGGKSANRIRGVSIYNPAGYMYYHLLSNRMYGPLAPYTGKW
jgi:RHS repeat-associated protein